MDLGLADRVFLVTGGASGLGLATARALVGEGARVVLSGRHEERLRAAGAELGERAIWVRADNADPETPERLIGAAQGEWGRLDGALVSVGGPPFGGMLEATDAQWQAGFESVFLGAVRLCRELAGVLGEGGSLALVLSSSVREPVSGLAISNGLRPGLAMAAKTLADELGPRGVRVNGLLPGRIATERLASLYASYPDPEAARAEMATRIPLRRDGEPEEFGRVAAFVLSPAASYLTGVMLAVDGGMQRSL